MSGPTPPAYKTRNWRAYNDALKRRGSLTIWFDPAMTWGARPTGKRGRQPDYSGEEDQKTVQWTVFPTNAIQTCLTMKVLFGMALRQIEPCCATGSSNHGEAALSRAYWG
jgi:hypothetical protein